MSITAVLCELPIGSSPENFLHLPLMNGSELDPTNTEAVAVFACQHYQILKPVQAKQLAEFLSTRSSTKHMQCIIMPCIITVLYNILHNIIEFLLVFFARGWFKSLWHPWHRTTLNFSLRAKCFH